LGQHLRGRRRWAQIGRRLSICLPNEDGKRKKQASGKSASYTQGKALKFIGADGKTRLESGSPPFQLVNPERIQFTPFDLYDL
jgi:hypothetical protein